LLIYRVIKAFPYLENIAKNDKVKSKDEE